MKGSNVQFRAVVNEVKRRASIVRIAEDAGIVLRREGSCYKGFCPFHEDSATASFALYEEKGRWRCFGACQQGGDVVDLYKRLHGLTFSEAVRELADRFAVVRLPSPSGREAGGEGSGYEVPPTPAGPVALSELARFWPYDRAEAVFVYPIHGGGEAHEVRYLAQGRKQSVLCRPVKFPGKPWGLIYGLAAGEYYLSEHCWRRVNPKAPRRAKRRHFAGARVGLYRPDVFHRARAGKDWVFCVEGPKDAEAAITLGLFATTSAGGASGLKDHQAEELRGHLVAVVGDHDEAGARGAAQRAKLLCRVAREVRVLAPLGGRAGSGYDLADYVSDRRREGATDAEIVQALSERVAASSVPTAPRDPPEGEKVEIVVTADEKAVNDAVLAALAECARDVFQRAGSLVHVVSSDVPKARSHRGAGSPVIRQIPEGKMREVLADVCRFVKVELDPGLGKKTRVERKRVVHPPQWSTRALLARGEWEGVDHLEAVVEGPVIRPDGSVLQEPGFDAESGLYYLPNAEYERVPERPDAGQVRGALALLREVVCDFPFQTEAHFAAWLSAVLTPLARFAFSGPSPLNLIDANTRGAGKSLLADVCNMIVTGRPAARMSYNRRDEAELRKAVTSVALAGDPIVLIDNVRGALGDATLDRALTATTWKDRLLGSHVTVELPLAVTWYATGNNVTLSADTARRVLHVRLESPEERPEERTGFRHPNLLGWIGEHRGRILPAALTLLRAFWVAGRPSEPLPGFGSFEDWSAMVRQCVVWLGLPDPVETRLELGDVADLEGAALGSLVSGLKDLLDAPHLRGEATVGEMLTTLERDPSAYPGLMEAFHELVSRLKAGETPSTRQLGYLLRNHRGKWVHGHCLAIAKDRTKKGTVWTVLRQGDDGEDGDDVSSRRGNGGGRGQMEFP